MKKSKDLHSRREFFKRSGKRVLPYIATIGLSFIPYKAKAVAQFGCGGSCLYSCAGQCIMGCYMSCVNQCAMTCGGGCTNGCEDYCAWDCSSGCNTGCRYTCNGTCNTLCFSEAALDLMD